jgi:thioredoxin 1
MATTIAHTGNLRYWLYVMAGALMIVLLSGCVQTGRVDPDDPENYVLDATAGLILVSFQAPDDLSSRSLNPVLDQLQKEYQGRVSIRQIDVVHAPGWKKKFGIQIVPTVCLFHHGQEVRRWVGAQSRGYLDGQLDTAYRRYESDQPVALTEFVDEPTRQ